jgi:hypothetical protein
VPRERHRPVRTVRTGYAAISEVYIWRALCSVITSSPFSQRQTAKPS